MEQTAPETVFAQWLSEAQVTSMDASTRMEGNPRVGF